MSIYIEANQLFSLGNAIKVFGSPNRSNIGIILGSEKTLLVDSGQNEEHIKLLFNFLNNPKIDFTVLTHYHMDHTFGLSNLDCTSIGHKNIVPNLLHYQHLDFSDQGLTKRVQEGLIAPAEIEWFRREYPDRSKIKIKMPTITFDKRMTIDLGNIEVKLNHLDCDHTNDTTIVYVPSEEALFIGDCLSPGPLPIRHFTMPVFHEMIDYFLSLESKILVEGHGPPLDDGLGNKYLSDLVKVADFVEIYRDETIQKIDLIMTKMDIFDKDSVKVYIPFFNAGMY